MKRGLNLTSRSRFSKISGEFKIIDLGFWVVDAIGKEPWLGKIVAETRGYWIMVEQGCYEIPLRIQFVPKIQATLKWLLKPADGSRLSQMKTIITRDPYWKPLVAQIVDEVRELQIDRPNEEMELEELKFSRCWPTKNGMIKPTLEMLEAQDRSILDPVLCPACGPAQALEREDALQWQLIKDQIQTSPFRA
jgi:hypothetical protein